MHRRQTFVRTMGRSSHPKSSFDPGPVIERLGSRITPNSNGCWICATPKGHRHMIALEDGRKVMAYRFVYELLVGPIAEGNVLHHECGEPTCCNPAHLRPLTRAEHLRVHATDCVAR